MSVDLNAGSADRVEAEWLAEFLDTYYAEELQEVATTDRTKIHVDAGDLLRYVDAEEDLDTILKDAEHYATVLEEAVSFADAAREAIGEIDMAIVDDAGANIWHYGVSEINAENVREYVGVSGQLAAVTKIREFPKTAVFFCEGCGLRQSVPQDTREFTDPTGACECESSPRWQLSYEETEWVDHRKLKIQQPPEEASNGETQHLTAHVFGDDVNDKHGTPLSHRVGESVVVYGTVELVQQDGRNGPEYLFDHYMRCSAVTFEETGLSAVDIDAHREEIEDHATAADVYERFYRSLAPQIEPIGRMELAMQLAAAYLFGAPRIDQASGPMFRGDIHLAIIGDPGMAKSVLLDGVAKFSPDSEHRSATGLASDVGLVAAAVEDDFGEGGWTLKPGILVRAGMHAIIDEIDKGPDDLEHINDALEGRQIATIDKAGMKAQLKTRTGLMVSGNPEGSRFNEHEPLAQQVDIDESLLTRFDAIVMLIDKVDEDNDRKVASHITDSYREGIQMERARDPTTVEQSATERQVSPEVGRAWVAMGREITPEFTEDAMDDLEEFYVESRGKNDDDTISSTARQLEAGLRLSAAYARMRLSETVEQKDVDMAIGVSKAIIGQTYDPENGTFDIDSLTVDSSPSNQSERINGIMDTLRDATEPLTPTQVAERGGIDEGKAEEQLERLYHDGKVVQPETGAYRDV